MSYQIAKKQSKATARVVQKCKTCDNGFHSFYNLREHRRKNHEPQRGSRDQNVDVADVMWDVDDKSLKEEIETCKHFLVNSEMENGRHRVYNFSGEILDPKFLLEKAT